MILNGQEIYILSYDELKILESGGEISSFDLNEKLLEFVHRLLPILLTYDEINLGLAQVGFNRSWFPYIILKIDFEYQRVFLEKIRCTECDWEGVIANPKIVDNYVGIPASIDKYKLMRESDKYRSKDCPMCKSKLSRPAIWLEY